MSITRVCIRQRLTVVLATIILFPATAHAQQEAPEPDTLPRYELEGVSVTVTRSEAERAELPRKVDVITATDIERTPATGLAGVLKKRAAVDVIQYPGLLSGVGIRGFRPQFSGINQRTLVLIDGRPAGITNLALIDLNSVQRIEVLKGPASALYGSNAMGGVVNVVTRKSRGDIRSSLSIGYGSFETLEGNFTTGGNLTDALDFDLGLALFQRNDDYRVGDGNLFRDWLGDGAVTKTFAGDSTVVVTDPGSGEVRPFSQYGTFSGSLRLGYRISDGWRIDARAAHFMADEVQTPGDLLGSAPPALKNVARSTGDVSLAGDLGRHALTFKLFTSAENAEYYNRPDSVNFISFRTPIRWYGLQAQDAVQIGPHTIIAGIDYTSARAESEFYLEPGIQGAPFSPNSEINSRAAFAQGRFSFLDDRLIGTLGGRLDGITFAVEETELRPDFRANRERYLAFNPSVGLQYRTPAGFRVHGTAGRAFVAPDAFNVAGYAELESFANPGNVTVTRGNPELEPENSFTWDAGIGFIRPRLGLEADVTYFHTDVDDRITSRFSFPESVELTPAGDTIRSIITYINADEAKIRGIEWRASFDLGTLLDRDYALRLFTNATRILRAEEIERRDSAVVSEIRNVAGLTLNYGIEYDDLDRYYARLSGRYVGERVDTDFSDFPNLADVRYPAFMTLDLATGVRLSDGYRISLLVSNLTDENYYEVRGYPLPGRAYRLRFTAEF